MLSALCGITVGELCGKLMLDNGTLSPLLKKMQQEGLPPEKAMMLYSLLYELLENQKNKQNK